MAGNGLIGKVALITGAASGIGEATAKRFADKGAVIIINDINEEGLQRVAAEIGIDRVKSCPGDISRAADVARIVEAALSLGGRLDIVVNSAAIDPPEREQDVDKALEMWHRIMDVNLTGAYLLMKLAIPHMVDAGGGAVVNIASLSGIRYMGGRPSYTASKGGLISLTQMAAVEYGRSNVRCNVICPGPVRTPLFTNNMKPVAKRMKKDVEWIFSKFTSFSPMRRMGNPEEIADICVFLCSDEASLVTGNVIVADGGAHLVDVNGAAMSTLFQSPDETGK